MQHDSFEDLVNDFDEIDDHMDHIIEDINESRYHSEEEDLMVDSDDEISDDYSESPVNPPSEGYIRSKRENSGTGVDRLEPTHGGKVHKEVKSKIGFLISENRKEAKQNHLLIHGARNSLNIVFAGGSCRNTKTSLYVLSKH